MMADEYKMPLFVVRRFSHNISTAIKITWELYHFACMVMLCKVPFNAIKAAQLTGAYHLCTHMYKTVYSHAVSCPRLHIIMY